jgi:hypothetical protein
MEEFELSVHLRDMLKERQLLEAWVWRALQAPDQHWTGDDANEHFAKAIQERDNRILHVVVNTTHRPKRVVTAFLDRRLRKKDETKNRQGE